MSAEQTDWAPLETGTSSPSAPADLRHGGTRRSLRLRRSRSPVIAALDGGGDVLQRRSRDVMVGGILLITPMVALNLWVTVLVFDRVDGTGPGLPGFENDATSGIEDVALLLAHVFASFTAAVVGVFAASILVGERFGRPVPLRSALTSTIRRLPAVAVAWVLGHWWLPLADLFIIGTPDDEVATVAFYVVPLAGVATAFTLYSSPVMVAEQVGPVRSLRRSWRLARLRFGSAFGFVASAAFVGGLVLAGIASLPLLLETTGFVTFGDYTWLANGIAAQLGVIVVVPLVALGTAQLYVEVRLDAEGMDLAIDTEAAFGASP